MPCPKAVYSGSMQLGFRVPDRVVCDGLSYTGTRLARGTGHTLKHTWPESTRRDKRLETKAQTLLSTVADCF